MERQEFLRERNSRGRKESPAERPRVGGIVGKKLPKIASVLSVGIATICLLFSNGCGSSAANVITVSVSPSADTLILGQSVNLTATVNGATNVNVNWTPQFISGKPPCQYTTTPSGGKTSALTNCPTDGS